MRRTDVKGVVTAIDVFDTSGREVATIRTMKLIGAVVFVRGNQLYTVVTDADDIPMVVRYRISATPSGGI